MLVSQNGCGVKVGQLRNAGRKIAYTSHRPDRRVWRRVSRSEGSGGQQLLGPGSQALLVAGVCGQSLVGWVLSCARPYHLSGLALVSS